MDIETLARELRHSQVHEREDLSIPWGELDEGVREYYRNQARYIQENVIRSLEERIEHLEQAIREFEGTPAFINQALVGGWK